VDPRLRGDDELNRDGPGVAKAEATVAAAPPSLAAAPSDTASTPSEPAGLPAPTYPTRPPPAVTLRYGLQRGLLGGSAELAWRPDGERYTLTLDARLAGAALLRQVSQGGFDAAGIAPLRFTDQRGRRGPLATNFQREAGKITYSGPAIEHPLSAGAQDRLSWMMQLAAIVAADPARIAGLGQVTLAVTGVRADLAVWDFRLIETTALATPLGELDTLHFVREPRGRYDTRAEVWLAPAHHHLPVRIRWRGNADSEALELSLLGIQWSP
jgi:hypothetical protein